MRGNWFLVKMERKVFMTGPKRRGNNMVLSSTTAPNFRFLKGRVVRGVISNHSQQVCLAASTNTPVGLCRCLI